MKFQRYWWGCSKAVSKIAEKMTLRDQYFILYGYFSILEFVFKFLWVRAKNEEAPNNLIAPPPLSERRYSHFFFKSPIFFLCCRVTQCPRNIFRQFFHKHFSPSFSGAKASSICFLYYHKTKRWPVSNILIKIQETSQKKSWTDSMLTTFYRGNFSRAPR